MAPTAPISGAARTLAGRGGAVRLRVARARLRRRAAFSRSASARDREHRRDRLQRVHLASAWACSASRSGSTRGETFSVYFGMFSRLAPLEVRAGRLGIRRPLAATTRWATVSGLARVGRDGDRDHGLRRGAGGRSQGRDRPGVSRLRRPRPVRHHGPPALAETLFLGLASRDRRDLLGRGPRDAHGDGLAAARAPRPRVRPHPDSRSRSPTWLRTTSATSSSASRRSSRLLLSDPLGNGSDYFGTRPAGIDYAVLSATADLVCPGCGAGVRATSPA